MRIHNSGVTENERNEGDEKSVAYMSEVSEFSEAFGACPWSCFSWFPLIGGVSGGWLVHRVEQ